MRTDLEELSIIAPDEMNTANSDRIGFDTVVSADMTRGMTYKEIAVKFDCSVGKVYGSAVRTRSRKNENRIQHRRDRLSMQNEFLESFLNTTVKGDVLDFLDGMPDNSIDLVMTSPPYNCGKQYGNGGDAMAPLRYFGWMCEIIAEIERVVKPGGVIAMVVGGTRDRDGRIKPLDWVLQDAFKQTCLTFRDRVMWPTPHGLTPAVSSALLAKRSESIMIYSKGEPSYFSPTAGRTPTKQYDKKAYHGSNKGQYLSHKQGSYPSDVWSDVPHVRHNMKEKTEHPAQFSEALARRVVEMYSECGATVLDIFSGSGTTQKVSFENGRSFIGADLFWEDERNERLAKAMPEIYRAFPGVTEESTAFWAATLSSKAEYKQLPWEAKVKRRDIPLQQTLL